MKWEFSAPIKSSFPQSSQRYWRTSRRRWSETTQPTWTSSAKNTSRKSTHNSKKNWKRMLLRHLDYVFIITFYSQLKKEVTKITSSLIIQFHLFIFLSRPIINLIYKDWIDNCNDSVPMAWRGLYDDTILLTYAILNYIWK